MKESQFKRFCAIAYDRAGIRLGAGKEALVDARVARRLRVLGLDSPAKYLAVLEADDGGQETQNFLNAITTNFTSFMREPDHFRLLHDQIRQQVAHGGTRLRIWCAAAATGEEPYSLAMTVLDAIEGRAIDFRILATDISTDALNKAAAGVYSDRVVAALTKQQRVRYMTRLGARSDDEPEYEVKPEVKEHILFRKLNLARPPFPMKGPFDFVFCRNVMIYFDNVVRQGLVSEAERLLRPQGFFISGHSESLAGLRTSLVPQVPSVYCKGVPRRRRGRVTGNAA